MPHFSNDGGEVGTPPTGHPRFIENDGGDAPFTASDRGGQLLEPHDVVGGGVLTWPR
jgi:hypothetical protein